MVSPNKQQRGAVYVRHPSEHTTIKPLQHGEYVHATVPLTTGLGSTAVCSGPVREKGRGLENIEYDLGWSHLIGEGRDK